MACGVCRNFPLRTVNEINEEVERGDLSLVELALRYKMSEALLDDHIKSCVTPLPDTGYELLEQMLRELHRTAEERKRDYEGGGDDAEAAMDHYISLVREARSTIMAMDRVRPTDDLVRDIIQKILSPVVNQCIVISTEEGNRLREELFSFIEGKDMKRADLAIKESLLRFAGRFKKETVELVPKLQKLLNVDATGADPEFIDAPTDGEPRFH